MKTTLIIIGKTLQGLLFGMCQFISRKWLALIPGLLVLASGMAHAGPLALSNVPLAVSTSVEPNVMLLLDNSGSMRNLVWDENFDDTSTTYTNWGAGRWNMTDRNIRMGSISSSCSGGKCTVRKADNAYLILPDPQSFEPTFGNGDTWISGRYLNYLFDTHTHNTDITALIPGDTRLTVMKNVANTLITNTSGIRYGLSVFNGNDGADVRRQCGATYSSITGSINNLRASTSTPLGEALYDVTRYFRGLYGSLASPIQYRCQKNFTIIVTDGLPTNDNNNYNSAGTDIDIVPTCNRLAAMTPPEATPPCSLPDWDKITADPGRFSDGPGGGAGNEGSFLFLDDIAKFAYDVDMMNTSAKTGANAPDYDLAGESWDGNDFKIQNMETFTVGFSINAQVLRDAAHYGAGLKAGDAEDNNDLTKHYFTANNQAQLLNQLQTAITNIEGRTSSAASVASNTGFISNSLSTYIFQGKFESNDWTGNLFSYKVSDAGVVDTAPTLDASLVMKSRIGTDGSNHTDRHIYSMNTDTSAGIEFNWASISPNQRTTLGSENVLNYVRGYRGCEISSAGSCSGSKTLRDRNLKSTWQFGSFINSAPVFIGPPALRYPDEWPGGSSAPENAANKPYSEFQTAKSGRKPVVYIGSNDGMLHAFDAETLNELFAYVPGSVYSNIVYYSDPSYTHRYMVDGTPTVMDVFFASKSEWKTVLVGGLNKGGTSIFALDVTNPFSFVKGNVLWEFTDKDLGFTYSRPSVVRMKNGKWVAIFGNGYNNTTKTTNPSTTGNAVLYIVDIETGALIKKLDTQSGINDDPTGTSSPNGLSTVAVVDLNNDYIADFAYAGDLFGNLWRFDISDADPNNWRVFGRTSNPDTTPIFVARGPGGNPQPITVRPEVSRTTTNGVMVYFGTGLYLQQPDKTSTSDQTFYAVLDDPEAEKLLTVPRGLTNRAGMTPQTMTDTTHNSETVRSFSANATSDLYSSWYVDLPAPGERVVGEPLLRGLPSHKRVIFTTIIPSTADACGFGGNSWIVELDARNGNKTYNPVFDLNFDGKLDKFDNGGSSNGDVYNGWYHTGISTSPTVISGTDKEFKFMSNSKGTLPSITEALPEGSRGRVMWQQLK
ncbi:MAG: PilC/PilY family type IV pilus protein [Gammaproteobacteria bacterium]|nr:PilC/PilY family type IV pilus protein [Gammaproteobacteria bacterium]MDH5651158.1 PilC/PilY family type IV pilus protein [Gammaproteobacteria bacterium]